MPAVRQVALIRGINVGRSKRVPMAELRELLEDLGYTGVRTLLNSGNAVYTTAKDTPAAAAARIEKALVLRLNVEARVVVLTAAEVSKVVAENTLRDVADDHSRLLVSFYFDPADRAKLKPLLAQDWDDDKLAVGSRAAYLWCKGGILDSPLQTAANRALKNAVTARNWATVLKLHAMMADEA